jgi:HAD superfamily hydrolase (TIGR01509 family)
MRDLPPAVLWDMDGTLVDSEPYWLDAETALIGEWGGVWTPEDGLQLVGNGLDDSARIIQSRGVELSVDEIIETLTDRVLERIAVEVPWRPGARELLASMREAGVRTALVTMSIRRMAQPVIDAIGFPAFDVTVTGDEVGESKPHPEPYLRAAQLLGLDAADCVAIEDSAPGIASAVAAGTVPIGVPAHVPLAPSPSYVVWPTLEGRTLDDVAAVWSEAAVA